MKNTLLPTYVRTLLWVTVIHVVVLFVRNLMIGESTFNFLLWNLFLGFLPLLVAYLLTVFYDKIQKWLLLIGSVIWLLFYPNAPYMVSDLIHVGMKPEVVLYDTLIIFSFAMLSLWYGFLSIKLMYALFTKWSSPKLANTALVLSLLLSSLGFYMGRILRFNSWDALTHPFEVIAEVWKHLFPIGQNTETYIVIFLFGGIQWLLLIMMKQINDVESAHT